MRFDSPTPGRTRRISPASSNSFKERLTVTELRDKAAASATIGKRTNSIPLVSSTPPARVASSRRAYMTFAVLLIGSRSMAVGSGIQGGTTVSAFHLVDFLLSLGSFGQVTGAVNHDSPEALFALMLTLPAQVVVGHTPPVIEEEGQLQLPFLAHSRHGASYHRKSAHFSRNGRDGRIAVFGVMFRGDFQGKYGHRAAWKSPIVSRTGQTTPRRFVMFG